MILANANHFNHLDQFRNSLHISITGNTQKGIKSLTWVKCCSGDYNYEVAFHFFYLGHWRQTLDCNIVNKLYWIWNWINPNLWIWFPGLRHWLLKMTIFIFCAVLNVSLYFRLASFLTLHNFIIAFPIACLALIVTDYLLFISGVSLIGLNWYRSAGYWIIFRGERWHFIQIMKKILY